MSQDAELEQQFLGEATNYLNTLEEVLIEVKASNKIDDEIFHVLLIATYFIKSSAESIEFYILSDLASRLDNYFQILSEQNHSLKFDSELYNLLLSGVDWLRFIVKLYSLGSIIDEQWITTLCYPVFVELDERLGNAYTSIRTVSTPENLEEIIPLYFQTKVDERIKSSLVDTKISEIATNMGTQNYLTQTNRAYSRGVVKHTASSYSLSTLCRVMLLESNWMLLAFRADVVEEIFLFQEELVSIQAGSEVLNWQEVMLPLIRLGRYLEFNQQRYNNLNFNIPLIINASCALILKIENQVVAVQLDRYWGTQEVVIRCIEGNIPLPDVFSCCTTLGDGRIVPVVNPHHLLHEVLCNTQNYTCSHLDSTSVSK
jgi:chemotaxis protein histidine kinase CheA